MPAAEYEDFELEIGSDLPVGGGPQQYYGRVIRSPAGEAPKSQVKFWFSAPGELAKLRGELENAVLEIDEKNRQGPTTRGEQVLRDFGRGVFRSVFTDVPSIQRIYERSKGAAQDLRIKLRIEAADLAGLPWEYLYDEDDMPGFVSLTRPIVRYLETAGGVGRMGVKGPLRILGMIADPSTSEWPKLNVVKERDRINKGIDALQHEGKVDFQWVPGGTGKDLMKKLLEGEWHIFHFIGHGGVEEALPGAGASGFVVMVDEDGKPVKKFASDLAMMLTGARRSMRLIVLNCCESARINVGDRFGNPAIGLMKTGWLPAVVAMQFPITDGAAISMSEGFYAALAGNRPIDDALTLARKFIQEKSRVEWGIPVLYMRSSDGRIFDVEAQQPLATPAEAARLSKEMLQQRRDAFMEALADRPDDDRGAGGPDPSRAGAARPPGRRFRALGSARKGLFRSRHASAQAEADPESRRELRLHAEARSGEARIFRASRQFQRDGRSLRERAQRHHRSDQAQAEESRILLDQGHRQHDGRGHRRQARLSRGGDQGLRHGNRDQRERAEISGVPGQCLRPDQGRGEGPERYGQRDRAGARTISISWSRRPR